MHVCVCTYQELLGWGNPEGWAGRTKWETDNLCKLLLRKPEEKGTLKKQRRRWEDNRMDLK